MALQKISSTQPLVEKQNKSQVPAPVEPKTLSPQRDRYKSIDQQILKPAYVRHGASFEDENEQVPTTIFQPAPQTPQEEGVHTSNDGSLF